MLTRDGRRPALVAAVPALLVALLVVTLLGPWLAGRAGDLRYDDANYLERGAFHARKMASHPTWQWPVRLPYSLSFEGPKPPLFHGWVAAAALVLGTEDIGSWIALCALGPFALLCGVVAYGGAREGWLAGLFSLTALLAMPRVVDSGTSVMVECLLAGLVTICALLVERELDRPTAAGAAALGAFAGLSALTKATALSFLLVPILTALVATCRRKGLRYGLRQGLLVAGAALAVAGAWYAHWASDAIAFARFAAEFPAWADPGARWSRPLRLLAEGLGWPLVFACVLLLVPWWIFRDRRSDLSCSRAWSAICLGVAVPPAFGLLLAPNFDARFWLPCLGAVAIGLGRMAGTFWSEARRWRWLLGLCTLVLPWVGVQSVLERPPVSTPWRLESWWKGKSCGPGRPLRVCALGSAPAWNVYKLRLLNELSTDRTTRDVRDLPVWSGSAPGVVESCDLVFALDPASIPADPTHLFSNKELAQRATSLEAAGFTRCAICESELAGLLPGKVWVATDCGPTSGCEVLMKTRDGVSRSGLGENLPVHWKRSEVEPTVEVDRASIAGLRLERGAV